MTPIQIQNVRNFLALDFDNPGLIEFAETEGEFKQPNNTDFRWWTIRNISNYRWRKRPEPRRVPYDFDSFPWPDSATVIRIRGAKDQILQVYGKAKTGVYIPEFGLISYECAEASFEMSIDGGATWQPCSRVEGGTE